MDGRIDTHRALRVLVADNADSTRERLRLLLGDWGHVQAHVCSIAPARLLKLLRELKPDCLLIDPSGQGRRVHLAQLRAAAPRCLIIVLTHEDSVEFRAHCLASGADHVLDKVNEFERAISLVGASTARE